MKKENIEKLGWEWINNVMFVKEKSFYTIREAYDKHFNLTTQRHGTTG